MQNARNIRGFTLIEMLAVLGIVAAMLLISGLAFQNFGRAAGIRGAVLNIRSSLSLARQRAITERKHMAFRCDNQVNAGRKTGYYVITNSVGQAVTETNYLTEGTYFDPAGNDITFNYDGSCYGSPNTGATPISIGIKEDRAGNTALSATISIQPLTGTIKTTSWVDD